MRICVCLPVLVAWWAVAISLATSAPFGSDKGWHENQLFDPIYPHVHVDQQPAPPSASDRDAPPPGGWRGPSSIVSAAEAVEVGVAVPLTIMVYGGVEQAAVPTSARLGHSREALPTQVRFAPPDPPPTLFA